LSFPANACSQVGTTETVTFSVTDANGMTSNPGMSLQVQILN
jgi:hypothetical protein